MILATTKPAQVLRALEKGPLTWRLLMIELGYTFAEHRADWGLWRRFWNKEAIEESRGMVCYLEALLADMCRMGLIVCLGDKPKEGPWTLPGACAHCNGSGKRAKGEAP